MRLFGGANYGDGSFEFSQPVYGVLESGSNALITIQRLGGEGTNAQTTVSVVFSTADDSPLAGTDLAEPGVDYTTVSNTVTFPLGETFETVNIPIINSDLVGNNKSLNLTLSGVIRPTASLARTPRLILSLPTSIRR